MSTTYWKLHTAHDCLECEDGTDGTQAQRPCWACHGVQRCEEVPQWRGAKMNYTTTPSSDPQQQAPARRRPRIGRPPGRSYRLLDLP